MQQRPALAIHSVQVQAGVAFQQLAQPPGPPVLAGGRTQLQRFETHACRAPPAPFPLALAAFALPPPTAAAAAPAVAAALAGASATATPASAAAAAVSAAATTSLPCVRPQVAFLCLVSVAITAAHAIGAAAPGALNARAPAAVPAPWELGAPWESDEGIRCLISSIARIPVIFNMCIYIVVRVIRRVSAGRIGLVAPVSVAFARAGTPTPAWAAHTTYAGYS